jgi:hypothetical protein
MQIKGGRSAAACPKAALPGRCAGDRPPDVVLLPPTFTPGCTRRLGRRRRCA